MIDSKQLHFFRLELFLHEKIIFSVILAHLLKFCLNLLLRRQ